MLCVQVPLSFYLPALNMRTSSTIFSLNLSIAKPFALKEAVLFFHCDDSFSVHLRVTQASHSLITVSVSQVFIINLLRDSKYYHFRPVMDTYIQKHFAGALAYK